MRHYLLLQIKPSSIDKDLWYYDIDYWLTPELLRLFWESEEEYSEVDCTSDNWVRNSEKAQLSWFSTLNKKHIDLNVIGINVCRGIESVE